GGGAAAHRRRGPDRRRTPQSPRGLAGGEVRRYRDRLYALRPLPPLDAQVVYPWDGRRPLVLPGNGVLRLLSGDGPLPVGWHGAMQVRYRRGGERCRLPGRQGSHALKKLFQESALLPPWVRERVPLVYVDGCLAAVGDLWLCEPFAGPGSGVTLSWSGHGLSYAR
ncbi:tRNA lysidine(34) synthetase TilS, partial [Methylogaea oryzae]|uniref:tRNA lysidine(34) synthetase TilS n=1 Tax=Methylogaea oryzae TaxID=1295382 RepID=UPI001C3F3919